jgi:hypothetical protein
MPVVHLVVHHPSNYSVHFVFFTSRISQSSITQSNRAYSVPAAPTDVFPHLTFGHLLDPLQPIIGGNLGSLGLHSTVPEPPFTAKSADPPFSSFPSQGAVSLHFSPLHTSSYYRVSSCAPSISTHFTSLHRRRCRWIIPSQILAFCRPSPSPFTPSTRR